MTTNPESCPCDNPECGFFGCYLEKEAKAKKEFRNTKAKIAREVAHFVASSGGAIPVYRDRVQQG